MTKTTPKSFEIGFRKSARSFVAFFILIFALLPSEAYSGKKEAAMRALAEALIDTLPRADHLVGKEQIAEVIPLMRVGSDRLSMVEKFGIRNIYQTGSSKGLNKPEMRLKREQQLYGLFELESPHPAQLFPKYGYLSYKTSVGKARASLSAEYEKQYGNLIFVFKPEVKTRMSYSLEDTMNDKLAEVSPLSDLVPLEEFQKSEKPSESYVEAQYLDTLTLEDVKEIWLAGPVSLGEEENLKRISGKFHIPILQSVLGQQGEVVQEHVQRVRTLDTKLTATPTASDAAHFELPSTEELVQTYSKGTNVEKAVIESVLAEKGVVNGLPSELGKKVQTLMNLEKTNLIELAIGGHGSRVKAAALHVLLAGEWPEPALTKSDVEKLVQACQNPEVFEQVKKLYPIPSRLTEAFNHQMGPSSSEFPIQAKLERLYLDQGKSVDLSGTSTSPIPVSATEKAQRARYQRRYSEFLRVLKKNLPHRDKIRYLLDNMESLSQVDPDIQMWSGILSLVPPTLEDFVSFFHSVSERLPKSQRSLWSKAMGIHLKYMPCSPSQLESILDQFLNSASMPEHRWLPVQFLDSNSGISSSQRLRIFGSIPTNNSEMMYWAQYLFSRGVDQEELIKRIQESLKTDSPRSLKEMTAASMDRIWPHSKRMEFLNRIAKLGDDSLTVIGVRTIAEIDSFSSDDVAEFLKGLLKSENSVYYRQSVAKYLQSNPKEISSELRVELQALLNPPKSFEAVQLDPILDQQCGIGVDPLVKTALQIKAIAESAQ